MCAQNRSTRAGMMTYMSISVVMIDLGNLRGQIFSPRTGFAPIVVYSAQLVPEY